MDADFLRKRLVKRGDKARMADAIGLDRDKLSKVLSGDRDLTPDEIAAVLQYFGLQLTAADQPKRPLSPMDRTQGFAEPDVKLLELPREPDRARALRALKPDLRHPVFYAARNELLSLAILAGDTLVVDLNRKADHGDIVVITRIDPETGESATLVRRWLDPWLISGRPDERPMLYNSNDQEIAFLGVVAASLRGILGP